MTVQHSVDNVRDLEMRRVSPMAGILALAAVDVLAAILSVVGG